MSVLTATFDAVNSRVVLNGTALGAAVSATMFSRPQGSTQWEVVRGANFLTVTAGVTTTVYDYEFPAFDDINVNVEYVMTDNLAVQSNTDTEVCTIANQAWLKFPGFPFLNLRLDVLEYSDIQRQTRGQLLNTVATKLPMAMQEYMGSRSFSFVHRTTTWEQARSLDLCMAQGALAFFHCDASGMGGLPSLYCVAAAVVTQHRGRRYGEHRRWQISIDEVAKPSSWYSGSIGTWQSVLNSYGTWTLEMAANATWADLLLIAGSPGDVVVS